MSEKKKEVTSLDELMDEQNTDKAEKSNIIDITNLTGKISEADPEETKSVTKEQTSDTPKNPEVIVDMDADLDKSSMKTVDIYDVLPREEQKATMEDELFSKLDIAVEKEKVDIDKRMGEIVDMQRKEYEAKVKAEEDSKQEEEDLFALEGIESEENKSEDDEYDLDDLLDEDAYETMDIERSANIVNKVSIDIDSDISEEADIIEDSDKNKTEAIGTDFEESVDVDNVDEVSEEKEDKLETVGDEENSSKLTITKSRSDVSEEKANILDSVEDDALFDEDVENESSSDEDDKMFNELKGEVKSKMTNIRKSIDLSKFTIAQKSINAQKVMKLAVNSHQSVADWMLYTAKRPMSFTGLSGPEILKLNANNSSRNRLNTFRDMYRVIYDHVFDANKPEFETWLKQLNFTDLPHVYFGLYMATFNGSNFITYTCPKCNKVFIKDIAFEDMVKYKDDEIKKKAASILKMDSTSVSDDYNVDLHQISNEYVFGIKSPSVWNVVIETASLSDKFLEKYSDMIDVVSYIDTIYYIDEESQRLIPIDTKPVPNDQAKTSARRIKIFYDIIKDLNSEDYYELRSKIGEYDTTSEEVSYMIPGCSCPDCLEKIEDNENVSPDTMLFTRHQLAAIKNM